MSVIARWRANLDIDVTSPDGRVRGVMSTEDAVRLEFRHDSYRHYSERSLEHQLERLAKIMWTRHRQGHKAVLAEVNGGADRCRPFSDRRVPRFLTERDVLKASGMSPSKCVHIEQTGFRYWYVLIKDGTLRRMPEADFATEVTAAYQAMMRDFRAALHALIETHFPDR